MGGFAQFLRNMAPVGNQPPPDAMTAPVQMSDTQHPMHAILAPLGPPPSPMGNMAGMNPDSTPTMSGDVPKVMGPKTPLDEQEGRSERALMADYHKDDDPFGSPDNHPGKMGKFLHGMSVLDRSLTNASGRMTARQQEEANLEKNVQGLEAAKSKEGLEGAQAAHTEAETPEVAPNAESTRKLQGAEAEHTEAETNALNSPSMIVHDTDAGPLLINPKTGAAQHVDVDGQPVGPKLKLTQSQPIDGPDGKPHTYMLDDKGNKVVDLGEHYERPINVNAGEKNLWSVPQPDGTKKVVALKPGDTIPANAVSLSGQSQQNSKEGSADAPTISALTFANDYLKSGAFTGPSDEALQDQFFQMAKPSSGFRMNQAQISQLHNMASWMDSWKGRAYHALNGTWFAPDQRQQIVHTMNELAKSKGIPIPGEQGGTGPQRPANVPEGYTYDAKGPKGAGWYAPTAK